MKISLAQIRSFPGDIQRNITKHVACIALAARHKADFIVFPELSLTGYEPKLAAALALNSNDKSFNVFQELTDAHQINVGIGFPFAIGSGVCISMMILQPGKERIIYSKKYLHEDELPYFVPGENLPVLSIMNEKIALSICYELSVPAHAKAAFEDHAEMYIASVSKHEKGVAGAHIELANIAKTYKTRTMMCNAVGPNDNFVNAGGSAIWDARGIIVGCLDNQQEALLLIDADKLKTQTLPIIDTI